MTKAFGKLAVGFLFDDALDSNDGVAQYVKNLGAWLSGQGHHVFYISGETRLTSWAGGPVYSLSKNIGASFNANRVRTPLPASRRLIKAILGKEKPDVLHVQVPYSPLLAGRVILAADPGAAIIGTFHIYPAGLLTRFGTRLLGIFCLRSLRRFDQMLSVSQPAADFARRTLGIKSTLSSNVVELSRFKAARARPQPGHIVFLGRLVKRKGTEELLKAFFILKDQEPRARLTIAGDGPQRARLERIVKQRGLSDRVKFLGYIDEKQKPNILSSAAIACFPSTGGESFGIVLIEAMAAGAGVVIGGNNPGYGSVLGKNSEALVDPRDSSAFAARLEKFLNDPDLAQKLHTHQQELVKQYDVAVVGSSLQRIYMEAIASRRQKP